MFWFLILKEGAKLPATRDMHHQAEEYGREVPRTIEGKTRSYVNRDDQHNTEGYRSDGPSGAKIERAMSSANIAVHSKAEIQK